MAKWPSSASRWPSSHGDLAIQLESTQEQFFKRRFVEARLLRSHDNKTTAYLLLLHLCIQFYQVYLLGYHFVNAVLLRAFML